ncbi:hypothetical protein, partial [Escherichia coli]|uniref:hypothetical protein n=1 Tax=Escherichia coli TaxID=562 RepID=UPI001C90E235
LNRLIRCVCGKKIGPDPRNFNQRVSLGRNDLLIRTFLRAVAGGTTHIIIAISTMYSLILRQNKTDKKSNESTLIQNLLT